MGKAEVFRLKLGESKQDVSEIDRIYAEIEKNGDILQNIVWHDPITNATKKELLKEGFTVDYENNCFIISW